MTVTASNYARAANDLPDAVRRALSYDEDTGNFTWRSDRALVRSGDIAGNIGRNGYRRITIDYRSYYAHHLAMAFLTGKFPSLGTHVDHINGDKTDNSRTNLRVTTPSRNGLNRRAPNRNNASGIIGVCEVKPGRFVAFITVNRKRRHLGTFDNLFAAEKARVAAHAEVVA